MVEPARLVNEKCSSREETKNMKCLESWQTTGTMHLSIQLKYGK